MIVAEQAIESYKKDSPRFPLGKRTGSPPHNHPSKNYFFVNKITFSLLKGRDL